MAFKGPLAVAPALLRRCTSCCSRSLKTAHRPLVMLVNMSKPGVWGVPTRNPLRGGEPPRRAEGTGYLAVRPGVGNGRPI